MSDCRIYKELLKLNNKMTKSNLKMGIFLNRYVTKEDIGKANKHMKIGSTSSVIREMQIKLQDNTSHLLKWKMAIIKKTGHH